MIFAHLAVSLPIKLPLHVRVRIHWTTTAVYLCVAASPSLPVPKVHERRAVVFLTDSTCVRPSLLSIFISSALPQAIIVVAGQRGNAPKVVVVANRAGTIPVIISDRPASQPRTLRPLTTPTFDSAKHLSVECDKNSDNAICYSNLIKINTSRFTQELSRHFKVMFLNTQSVRNKTTDICDHVMHANVDLIFLCETWLRPEGDESDCVALTRLGFV